MTLKKLFISFFITIFSFLPSKKVISESKTNVNYPYKWVYNSAIRLLKVDLKCEIKEESEKGGFIIFLYEYKEIKSPASIEIIDQSTEENGYNVSIRVLMEKLPSWVEDDLIERLLKKIKDDYGSPPMSNKKKKEDKEEKKGTEEGKDK